MVMFLAVQARRSLKAYAQVMGLNIQKSIAEMRCYGIV